MSGRNGTLDPATLTMHILNTPRSVCGAYATYTGEQEARIAAQALLEAARWSGGWMIPTRCVDRDHWHLMLSGHPKPADYAGQDADIYDDHDFRNVAAPRQQVPS